MTKEKLRELMGINIRNERLARNMSIDELAELLELTSGFVGLIERGRRGATAYTLLKLSDIFDMPIDNIFMKPSGASISVAEETARPNKAKAKRNKVFSLIADFTESELDFLIRVIGGVKEMNHTHMLSDEYDEDEEDVNAADSTDADAAASE